MQSWKQMTTTKSKTLYCPYQAEQNQINDSVQTLMPPVPAPAVPSSMTQEAHVLGDTSHCNHLQLNDPPHAVFHTRRVHT